MTAFTSRQILRSAAALAALLLTWPLAAVAVNTVEVSDTRVVIGSGSVIEASDSAAAQGVESWTLPISGVLTVRVTENGFNCTPTPFGNLCAETFTTLQLVDADIDVDVGQERPFIFPAYPAEFNSPPDFSSDNGPCTVLLPGETCGGTRTDPLSTMNGSFDGETLSLSGVDPAPVGGGVEYVYTVLAGPAAPDSPAQVAVPAAGAPLLVVLAVLLPLIARRYRSPSR